MTSQQLRDVARELKRLAAVEQAYHLSDTMIPELEGLLAGVDPVELRVMARDVEHDAAGLDDPFLARKEGDKCHVCGEVVAFGDGNHLPGQFREGTGWSPVRCRMAQEAGYSLRVVS